jgi:hypothetical protein
VCTYLRINIGKIIYKGTMMCENNEFGLKKLFIHHPQCGHLQRTSLVPAHTFSCSAAIACSIPGMQLVGSLLRPALQPSRCPVASKWCPFTADFTFLN